MLISQSSQRSSTYVNIIKTPMLIPIEKRDSIYYSAVSESSSASRRSVASSNTSRQTLKPPMIENKTIVLNKKLSIKPPREVLLRIKFIRLGEVITLHERFYAEVVIEARWLYDPAFASWNPNLYIKNSLGDVKQEITSELVNHFDEPVQFTEKHCDRIYVWEIRKVIGSFWEKLELNHFPVDVQQLSLQIVTRCSIDECILVENPLQPSMVNREAFLAQQEWFLYEHIETRSTVTTEEFCFRPIRQSTYLVTCYVARRPGYFYWNVYLLIFLITLIALTVYGVAPELPQSRLQITCTLLLTSIMFRWSVSRLLPPVSYLTLLDKYTLVSLVFISLNSIWHSIIGFLLRHMGVSRLIDTYILGVFSIFFLMYHCSMGYSLYQALRYRQVMLENDRQYAMKLAGMFETFAQGHHAVRRFQDRQSSSARALFI